MLGRLAAKDNHKKRLFKPQIYKGRGNFSQRNYQDRNRSNNRSNSRDRGQFRDRPRSQQNYRGSSFQGNFRGYSRQTAEGNIETIAIDVIITIEVGLDQEKGHSQEVTAVIELGVQVVVDLGQDPGPIPIGIG